jgi:cysteine desulfurase
MFLSVHMASSDARIYLDNAATTAIEPAVVAAMADSLTNLYGNPSSAHKEGRAAKAALEEARARVAACVGAEPDEIYFTGGGTEAANAVLKGAVRDLQVRRIISSAVEHHCVTHSLHALEAGPHHVEQQLVRLDGYGNVELAHLQQLLEAPLAQGKTLVCLMHCNNELGTLLDLQAVGDLCSRYGALFYSDTVQSIGFFPVNAREHKLDFFGASAHKFHGPKGAGFMYVRRGLKLRSFLDGGPQESGLRAGTEALPSILGLAEALRLACVHRDERRALISAMRSHLLRALLEAFPGLRQNSPADPDRCHYKILNVSFPASPASVGLLSKLDELGVAVSGGSACVAPNAKAASHVLAAVGVPASLATVFFFPCLLGRVRILTLIPRQVRFSFSHHNTMEEVDRVLQLLKRLLVPQL